MKRMLSLLLTLTMLLGTNAAARAETTFYDYCRQALTTFAKEHGLDYMESMENTGYDRAIVQFDMVEKSVIVGDSTFWGTITCIDDVQIYSLMYAFFQVFDTLEGSIPADCKYLVMLWVRDSGEDGTSGIYASNVEEIIPSIETILLFSDFTDENPVRSETFIEHLFSISDDDAQDATSSAVPSAYSNMDWLGQNLTLIDFYEPEGDELAELWETLETSADFVVLRFASPDGDLLQSDVDDLAFRIQLCDEYGNLTEAQLCTSITADLENEHSSEEYCSSFALTFALYDAMLAEDYLLFMPGESDCTLYTYGADFAAPDRRIAWNGHTLWLSGYSEGESMDQSDFEALEEGEKFLEVELSITSRELLPASEFPSDILLEDADGEVTSLLYSVHYASETVGQDEDKCYTRLHIVYTVPEEFDYDYYTVYVDGDYDRALPLVEQ